jgi:hypothetical protein
MHTNKWINFFTTLNNISSSNAHKLTHLLAYSTQQSPSWEANRFSASQEIPAFYGTLRFINVFTSAHQLSLIWASSKGSTPPYPIFWKSILILSSHLCLGLPSRLPTNIFVNFCHLHLKEVTLVLSDRYLCHFGSLSGQCFEKG